MTVSVVSADPEAAAVFPETLTSTPFAWNALQTVTVTGVEDSDTDGETVLLTHDGAETTTSTVTVTATTAPLPQLPPAAMGLLASLPAAGGALPAAAAGAELQRPVLEPFPSAR